MVTRIGLLTWRAPVNFNCNIMLEAGYDCIICCTIMLYIVLIVLLPNQEWTSYTVSTPSLAGLLSFTGTHIILYYDRFHISLQVRTCIIIDNTRRRRVGVRYLIFVWRNIIKTARHDDDAEWNSRFSRGDVNMIFCVCMCVR